jgi:transposase
MLRLYVGLDLGSSSFQLAVTDAEGKILSRHRDTMNEQNLLKAFSSLVAPDGELHVHMEAGELAPWVRCVIAPVVSRVVISHPMFNSWIAKDPNKSDKIDARKLADLLRTNLFREVYYSEDPYRRQFKQLVQHYDAVTRAQASLKRRIKSRLRTQGIIIKTDEPFTRGGRQRVLARVESEPIRASISQLYELLERNREMQHEARQLMISASSRFPEVKLFQSVPGIGPIGAARFSAYVQTPTRFPNCRKLWKYCKLGVSFRSSDGTPLDHPHLDKQGCGCLKDVMRKAFEAAMRRREENGFQRAYRASLERTHNSVHARLSVMRKIVSVLRAMWLEMEPYRDELVG